MLDSAMFPGGGKVLAPSLQTNFFASRTWTAPQDGIIVVRAMGAGGGGAARTDRGGSSATGGYSGSWGAKALRVKKNTVVTVSIGAGGAGRSGATGDGTAGGNTTVTVNGVTYTAYGGPGGRFDSASAPPDGPSPSSNWDFGAASVKPGWVTGGSYTGGAGVDILAQGGNATTSSLGGGGTGYPASSGIGGGAVGTAAATLQPAANPPVYFDAGGGDWGISFYGGSGGSAGVGSTNGGIGGNGGGGGGGGISGGQGGFGGGGGAGDTFGGSGGLGGGGGGGAGMYTSSAGYGGNGGNGYAHLKFYADTGL